MSFIKTIWWDSSTWVFEGVGFDEELVELDSIVVTQEFDLLGHKLKQVLAVPRLDLIANVAAALLFSELTARHCVHRFFFLESVEFVVK